ncbi:MAG TPA: hypothetical protein VM942_11305 [Acidimicrobiales bacterium]|nr:hypothetical protein [Acidimicrobiales bacterium]
MTKQERSEQEGSEQAQEPALDAEVTDEDATEITGGRRAEMYCED